MFYEGSGWNESVTVESKTLAGLLKKYKEIIMNNTGHMNVNIIVKSNMADLSVDDLDCETPDRPDSFREFLPAFVYLCGSEGDFADLDLWDYEEGSSFNDDDFW